MSAIDELVAALCPNGVEYRKLSDLGELFGGYSFKSAEYTSTGARVIRISDVQAGTLSSDAPKYCPINQPRSAQKAKLLEGDLVISLTGYVGRVAVIDAGILPAYLNQRVEAIRMNSDSVMQRYVFHYLNRDSFANECEQASSGSAQKNLSSKWLERYEIPVPPIEAQREIVRILDSFTELEAELEARKAQYSHYRDRLLSRENLEAMDGKPVELKTIGSCCQLQRGKVMSKDYIKENRGIFPVYSSQTQDNGVLGTIDSYMFDGRYLTWTTDGANAGLFSIGVAGFQ